MRGLPSKAKSDPNSELGKDMQKSQMKFHSYALFILWVGSQLANHAHGQFPDVQVANTRCVFRDSNHNAFTDLIRFQDRYYLTFRTCPDGHGVNASASIKIMVSDDIQSWSEVHQFRVSDRDTRDPHFLVFKGKLFVYSGTWYCGKETDTKLDLNQHLGFAVFTEDGRQWSEPQMLEGTYGHYVWRAAAIGNTAYLCGRRKHQFGAKSHRESPSGVESVMLRSEDGLVWSKHSLFQETSGNETAFAFLPDQSVLGIARRDSHSSQLIRSSAPYIHWQRIDLDRFIGGPLLARWGNRWVVGGRKVTAAGPRTVLSWLDEDRLDDFAELPSAGDNSYPGWIELSDTHALVSWYSTHEQDEQGKSVTAIYLADLFLDGKVQNSRLPPRTLFTFKSNFDKSDQTAYLSGPEAATQPTPLVVSLHSWSGDLEQRNATLETLTAKKGWYCLQPDFRGVNDRPEACASPAAQQDILDAIAWVVERHPVDVQRVYLTGSSGGGHMTMMMAARFPERWRAASAWVGISDLVDWHSMHRDGRYGRMLRSCCGGAPGDSLQVDEQYRLRSPISFLSGARNVALDIAAGIHDGHNGSVLVRQSLNAYNVLAKAANASLVSAQEIEQLSVDNGRLTAPQPGDEGFDESFGRAFYLRRRAANARVTIFEGGHEGIASAVMAWFEKHPEEPK
jgi:poly(3-hydroxybutyrate) depolymerase